MVLNEWRGMEGDRALGVLGSNLASALMQQGPQAMDFLVQGLGVGAAEAALEPGDASPAWAWQRCTGMLPGVYALECPMDLTPPLAPDGAGEPPVLLPESGDGPDLLLPGPVAMVVHEVELADGLRAPAGLMKEETGPIGVARSVFGLFDVDGAMEAMDGEPALVAAKAGGVTMATLLLADHLNALGFAVAPGSGTDTPPTPTGLVVLGSHPNPFNPRTEIRFIAPTTGWLEVRVYDIAGRKVAQPFGGIVNAGAGSVGWDGTDADGAPLASGLYLYQVAGFGRASSGKMVLLR
jgi:hypothetical protein